MNKSMPTIALNLATKREQLNKIKRKKRPKMKGCCKKKNITQKNKTILLQIKAK